MIFKSAVGKLAAAAILLFAILFPSLLSAEQKNASSNQDFDAHLYQTVNKFGEMYLDLLLGEQPSITEYSSVEDLEQFLLTFPRIDVVVSYFSRPDVRSFVTADDAAFGAVCRLMGATINRAVNYANTELKLSPEDVARRDELGELARISRETPSEYSLYLERMKKERALTLKTEELRSHLAVLIANRFGSNPSANIEAQMDEIFADEVDGLRPLVLWILNGSDPESTGGPP